MEIAKSLVLDLITPDKSACRLEYRIRRSAKSSSLKRRLSVLILPTGSQLAVTVQRRAVTY